MGGLPRRATLIRHESEQGIPLLALDAGNAFADRPLSEAAVTPTLAKAELILKAMERMGYGAMAVGELDLYLGHRNLEKLQEGTSVAFLSANLLKENGEPLFTPFVVLMAGGTRVGVLGLTSRTVDVSLMEKRAPGVWVEDPVVAASKIVPKLRRSCDLVVALTNTGYDQDLLLAREVEGIDVIIGGKSKRYMTLPTEVNQTLVTSGFFQGRALGRISVSLGTRHTGWVSGNDIRFLERQISTLQAEASPAPSAMENLDALKARAAQLASLTRYDADMVNLTPDFADDPQVERMIAEYRRNLTEQAGVSAQAVPMDLPLTRYVGLDRCIDCHRSRALFWMDTPHARAFDTLKAKDATADPDCLPCHVTGYLRPTGYSPSAPRDDLTAVQCEVCHGIGSLHSSSPEQYRLMGKPPATVCRACHTPNQDDDFDFARDRVLVCGEK